MIRYCVFLFLIMISCDSKNGLESPTKNYFVKFYGEDGDHQGIDFVVNSDGSFILLGNERIDGGALGQQIYLVKVDALGTVIWHRSFGIAGDEFAKDIELTTDGKIIIAAESQKEFGDRDVYLKILTSDGNPLDSVRIGLKTLDNQDSDEEVNSISIIQTGFIVSGSTTAVATQRSTNPNDVRDALHLRFDNALELISPTTGLWKNSTGLNDSDDVLVKMIEIDPSTYYGFGYTNTIRDNNRDYKYWAFSLGITGEVSNNGTELLDAIGNSIDDEILDGVIESPIQSGDGFILSGVKTSGSNVSSSFIVRLQKRLFVLNEDNVLNEESPLDLGTDVGNRSRMAPSARGGFLLVTSSRLLSNDKLDISLIKLNNTFLREWQAPVYFGGVGDDFAGTVKELPDGKIMIVGTMTLGGVTGQTKLVLMKLNSEGKLTD